ncbi:MAG TPA: hypothetical protein VIC33_12695 [Vicinamibacterales bacterium]|jgi:hypothetical protein
MRAPLVPIRKLVLPAVAAIAAIVLVACGSSYFEIPIQTPIKPKLDVSAFQRVLVAGFVAGGGTDIDPNVETVRLLRSQLRLKSHLKVIDADAMPLAVIARDQAQTAASNGQPQAASADGASTAPVAPGASPSPADPANGAVPAPAPAQGGVAQGQTTTPPPAAHAPAAPAQAGTAPTPLPAQIKDDKDLAAYDRLFANTAYWKKLGEEYQSPLIVTGTVLFTPHDQSGFVQREQEVYDSFGRRQVVPVRTYMERKGYILRPKFVFIDGRTGATLYSETFREEVLYDSSQDTPALSSYFELMDRVMPGFLNTLASQKIRGTRVLLK